LPQIADYRVVPLTAPYVRLDTPPEHWANGYRNCVWLRVEADDGTVGWGEAYWGVYATEATVAALVRCEPHVLGADASNPVGTMQEVRFRARYWAMRGLGAQALSAVEAALWDIAGQLRGEPVWRMLGGPKPNPVPLYASAGDDSLEPGEIAAQVGRMIDRGFEAYKMRCGGRAGDERPGILERDLARVAAARDALGPDRLLMVDVSVPQRRDIWPTEQAIAYVEALAPFRLAFLEEPAATYDIAGYKQLRTLGKVPIAGGESFTSPEEFEPFFAAEAYDVVQPDAAVVGGPASCVQVARRALEHGVKVALHAWSAGIGLAQGLHAGAAVPGILVLEWPLSEHAPASVPIEHLIEFSEGSVRMSDEPGLGVRVSEDFLITYRYRPGYERVL
jgi:D-galactarolactone cycloisomerase